MTNRSLPRVPVMAWMLGQRLVLHLASRHWLDYWLLLWWLAGAVIRAWTEKAATWESHWALSGIMVLSMTKGVPEFDSVQNQDTECLSPSFRRPLSLNKGLQDKLENKRALVDRKRKKAFVMFSSHFLLHTLLKHMAGENKPLQKPTYLCTAVFQGDIWFNSVILRHDMLCFGPKL